MNQYSKPYHSRLSAIGNRVGAQGINDATTQINMEIEQHFRATGLTSDARWYHCRPIMITQNDYGLYLFNGDIGITLVDEEGNSTELR